MSLNTRRPRELPADAAPLDAWLKFDDDDDETPSHEANTYRLKGGGYAVGWCHADVGLVVWETFPTYPDACAWLTSAGFDDFTS